MSVGKQLSAGHLESFKAKPQHGAFYRQLILNEDIDVKKSLDWVQKCQFPPYVESYMMAAQELAFVQKFLAVSS